MGTQGVIVGRVVEVRSHPNGTNIWLAIVDLGRGSAARQESKVQIVWGGLPIVAAGNLVPVAPPGARVPGQKMRRRNYRGESSFGMLCSLAELGWDPDVTDRVALLDPSAGLTPGTPLDDRADDWLSIVLAADPIPA